jgi:hypothetical protein
VAAGLQLGHEEYFKGQYKQALWHYLQVRADGQGTTGVGAHVVVDSANRCLTCHQLSAMGSL